MKDQTGHYKVPYGNVFAVAGILLSFWLLSSAKKEEMKLAGIFLGAGVLLFFIHFCFSKRK
jgi:hypothetical protein